MRRTVVDVKWFATCATFEEVKRLYKTLVMQHHPDKGGSLQDMQEINVEYDMLKKDPSRLKARANDPFGSKRTSDSWSNVHDCPDFEMKPGRYECRIIDVRENDEKKYVALVFDVDDGPHKGHFRFKPWFKHVIYLSYKTDWQLAKAKRIIGKINASNHGFDGSDAFCNDKSYLFKDKRLGISFTEEYLDGDGFINPEQVYVI